MIINEIAAYIGYSASYCGSKLQMAICRLKRAAVIDEVLGKNLQNKPKEAYTPKYLVENFDFDIRTYNALKRAGINSLEQISDVNQLFSIKGIGKTTVKMIEEAIKTTDLPLAGKYVS